MTAIIIYCCIVAIVSYKSLEAKTIGIIFSENKQQILSNNRIKRQFGVPQRPRFEQQSFTGPPNIRFVSFPKNNEIFFDNDNIFNDNVESNRPRQFTTTTTFRPGSTTLAVPGMGTTRSACEDRCQTTAQYNPVCGDNNITYMNIARFQCAVRCGKNIQIAMYKACPLFG